MKTIGFRFFFIYFIAIITPWFWYYPIPGIPFLYNLYSKGEQWIVELFNTHLLHVKDHLNMEGGGSGDTSYAWAGFYTYLILAAIGALIWTLLDRRRKEYSLLDFILKNVVRYNVAMAAFGYGIIKVFALQMPEPNLNQLATPLGDFLPMRLSWMFIGYSTTYQVFSGIMEIMVGLFLLYRRTVTLGSMLGVAVFMHVFLLNVSYDIPVKLYSLQLTIECLFLVHYDWQRIVDFFFLNKSASATHSFDYPLPKKWQRLGRVVFKIAFIIVIVILPFRENWNRYKEVAATSDVKPITAGVYAVKTFIKNNDTIPNLANNDFAWKEFIFEKGGLGSIATIDTLFTQRYHRGYFSYKPDTTNQTLYFLKYRNADTLFSMAYNLPDDRSINLWGKIREDTLRFELVRTDRHFQLMEKQFHWISESNR